MKTCPNCGERVYALGCVNCNEADYIEVEFAEELAEIRAEMQEAEWRARHETALEQAVALKGEPTHE